MLRILLAGPGGTAGPDDAVVALARALRDAGHEVVRTGPAPSPEQVVAAVLQEDADLVGLSAGSGDGVTDWRRVRELLVEHGADDVVVLGSGVVPDGDRDHLRRAGVVLAPGDGPRDVVTWVATWAASQERVARG